MAVKVIYRLTAVGLAVNHKTGALFFAAVLFGNFLGPKKQPSKQGSVFGAGFHNAPDMLFGYYQEMYRRLGVNVRECQKFIIFEQFLGRNFPADDFTEYTVAHAQTIAKNP